MKHRITCTWIQITNSQLTHATKMIPQDSETINILCHFYLETILYVLRIIETTKEISMHYLSSEVYTQTLAPQKWWHEFDQYLPQRLASIFWLFVFILESAISLQLAWSKWHLSNWAPGLSAQRSAVTGWSLPVTFSLSNATSAMIRYISGWQWVQPYMLNNVHMHTISNNYYHHDRWIDYYPVLFLANFPLNWLLTRLHCVA